MADKKISELTNYTPPLDADVLPIVDTAGTATKKVTWANIKATLKTYFDAIYNFFAAVPTADTVSGITMTLTANENQALGDVCHITVTPKAGIAKADAIANANGIVLAAGTIGAAAAGTYLAHGVAHCHTLAPGWTIGLPIYLSVTGTTGNTMTQTPPAATNNVIQYLGTALAADTIFFNPCLVQVEHV